VSYGAVERKIESRTDLSQIGVPRKAARTRLLLVWIVCQNQTLTCDNPKNHHHVLLLLLLLIRIKSGMHVLNRTFGMSDLSADSSSSGLLIKSESRHPVVKKKNL